MSDEPNFTKYIAAERERLSAERGYIFNQQEELQRKLDEINREFAAIEAYEAAKIGKAPRAPAAASRQQRARRGTRREELLNVIREGDGLTRGEILERMGLKGDKSGEMSVSNALTALTKRNMVYREKGRYYLADAMAHAAE
jgi:DNA-binding transcriptional ArsR family regulator